MAKVMLVEDDLTMVNLLTTLLTMDGFEVIPLDADDNVPVAVRRLRPDVLLLDVHLANQNGIQILEDIRRSKDIQGTRVVMVSGLNLRDECLRKGANGFLLKPFMPDDLIKILQKTLKIQ